MECFQSKSFSYWFFTGVFITHYISPFGRFSSGLMNANPHWGTKVVDLYPNENKRLYVTVCLKYHLNRKLSLFTMKTNSVCKQIIPSPVHSELTLTCSSIYLWYSISLWILLRRHFDCVSKLWLLLIVPVYTLRVCLS